MAPSTTVKVLCLCLTLQCGSAYWKTVMDKTRNRPYYYETETRKTTWTKPPELAAMEAMQKAIADEEAAEVAAKAKAASDAIARADAARVEAFRAANALLAEGPEMGRKAMTAFEYAKTVSETPEDKQAAQVGLAKARTNYNTHEYAKAKAKADSGFAIMKGACTRAAGASCSPPSHAPPARHADESRDGAARHAAMVAAMQATQ